MNIKRSIVCLALSVLMCTTAVSCSKSKDSSSNTAGAGESESVGSNEVAVAAQSGEAYLQIIDGSSRIQYLGKFDSPTTDMLAYNAGVTKISGNGDYKVSVTTNTKGYRKAMTGDEDNASVVPAGLFFMAVMIKDGEKLFPDAVITVNSIKVNGTVIPMKAKAYTSSDDGSITRANLFNEFAGSTLPKDARAAQGHLYDENGKAAANISEYSPVVVDSADFARWNTVEVNFTVTGVK